MFFDVGVVVPSVAPFILETVVAADPAEDVTSPVRAGRAAAGTEFTDPLSSRTQFPAPVQAEAGAQNATSAARSAVESLSIVCIS